MSMFKNVPWTLGIIISFLPLFLVTLSLALPYWLEAELMSDFRTFTDYHLGIFHECFTSSDAQKECSLVKTAPLDSSLQATRAMELIGVLLGAVATLAVIKCGFVDSIDQKEVTCFVFTLNTAAAGFVLAGVGSFSEMFIELRKKLHETQMFSYTITTNVRLSWAYVICIVGGIFFLFSGFIHLLKLPQLSLRTIVSGEEEEQRVVELT